jgi:hypothetical protein
VLDDQPIGKPGESPARPSLRYPPGAGVDNANDFVVIDVLAIPESVRPLAFGDTLGQRKAYPRPGSDAKLAHQIEIAVNRMNAASSHLYAPRIAPGTSFAAVGKPGPRAAAGHYRIEAAAQQSLKIDDEIIPLPSQ